MVCIIVTNVAPRELIVATEQVDLLRHGRPFVFTTESLGCNDAENPRVAPTSQQSFRCDLHRRTDSQTE